MDEKAVNNVIAVLPERLAVEKKVHRAKRGWSPPAPRGGKSCSCTCWPALRGGKTWSGTRRPAPRGGKESSHPLLPIYSRSTSSPPTRYYTTEVTSHIWHNCSSTTILLLANLVLYVKLPAHLDGLRPVRSRQTVVRMVKHAVTRRPASWPFSNGRKLTFILQREDTYFNIKRIQIQINISKEIQINIGRSPNFK